MASFLSTTRTATPEEALALKRSAAANKATGASVDGVAPRAPGVKPGSERWPVKTGADDDSGNVGTVVVDTTVREMGAFARPPELQPDTDPHRELDSKRIGPVETTIWRVHARIIALKMESDGDYHLVLQDDSGATMIAEIPLPDPQFVNPTSPFFDDIATARKAADAQFNATVSAVQFAPSADGKFVPRSSLSNSALDPVASTKAGVGVNLPATTTEPGTAEVFSLRIDATLATVTGVGFFDRSHGATGAAPNVVELHPVLEVTFGS